MRWSLRPPSSVSPIARGGPPPAPTMTASDPTPNMEIRLTGCQFLPVTDAIHLIYRDRHVNWSLKKPRVLLDPTSPFLAKNTTGTKSYSGKNIYGTMFGEPIICKNIPRLVLVTSDGCMVQQELEELDQDKCRIVYEFILWANGDHD
ncbi:hypothetical protein Zm00014a_010628 [Zea mays]|uniref:Uncharacterized protein n=1 Tax=Zea mays TaxID=4577 RepID=A0A3L6DZG4_MAIZE|nr:hypothetical protein Zm00014a_010628 [Zea mays]